MRELVERGIDGGGVRTGATTRTQRRVTVNLAESPLGWLRSRGLVDARQFEAGERLRGDYEMAALGPRVTMHWAARVDGGAPGNSGGDRPDDGADFRQTPLRRGDGGGRARAERRAVARGVRVRGPAGGGKGAGLAANAAVAWC